jgi:hypothetical protein
MKDGRSLLCFCCEGTHHSKESGHKRSHNIDIVFCEEQVKFQGFVSYHHIDVDHFSS